MKDAPFNFADRFADAGPSIVQQIRLLLTTANLWATVRTLLWLTPLTVLVWFYAARSISKSADLEFPLSIRSSDPNRVITIQDPADRQVRISILGPQSEVDRLVDQQKGELSVTLQATQILVAQNPATDVLLRDGTDIFKNSRVQIQRWDPPQIVIYVDEFVERAVPVRKPESVTNLESATFEPSQVTVRARAQIAAAAAADKLYVEADIAALPQLKDPGKKDPITVALRSPFGGPPNPPTVTATLDVRSDDVPFVISSVPVFASLPQTIIDTYKLTLQPNFIANVRVLGPPEQIALLKKEGEFPVRARLDFVPSELREDLGRSRTKKPTFELPEGVRVDPTDMERMNVEWALTRRDGG